MRSIRALLFGYVIWTALWLSGNICLRGIGVLPANPERAVTSHFALFAMLILGTFCSVFAGHVAKRASRSPSLLPPIVLAALLFATGCYFERQNWHLTPVWYHCVFLGMLIPATLAGSLSARK
jgi:uncharacterized membrane protein YoaK (UPF0700 family)